MARQIFTYILHQEGLVDDSGLELLEAAQCLDPNASITAVVLGQGANLATVAQELASAYQNIWKVDDQAVAYPNAEIVREVLIRLIPRNSVVLVPHEHFGMDLAPGLSVKLEVPYLPDAVAFESVSDDRLHAVREEYSGQVSTHVACSLSKGAVISVRQGVFQPGDPKNLGGQITDKTADALKDGSPASRRRYLEVVEAEVGDVDITKSEVLVSVGRGIEDEDNLELIHELAEAMGGDVSCSRPIVDAKWLEKSRQVGTSGKTVKPKVYMALGISGSFQHLGGIKGAPFIVAVNRNPNAPIFQAADVGVVADILDFVPDLTEAIIESK
jgi:electron transfer flavoprotein alpha subunit